MREREVLDASALKALQDFERRFRRVESTQRDRLSLQRALIIRLLIERGEITVDCEFCGMRYGYQQADVDRVVDRIDTLKKASEGGLLH